MVMYSVNIVTVFATDTISSGRNMIHVIMYIVLRFYRKVLP